MKGRHLIPLLSIMLAVSVLPVRADDDYSDTTYWTNLCTSGNLTSAEKTSCQGFVDYMSSQSDSLSASIADIDSQKEQIAANIEEYAAKISDYQTQIDSPA